MILGAKDRMRGAWWGAYVADALAMPVHGYPSKDAIEKDYGYIVDMLTPREPYPNFVLADLRAPELPANLDYIGSRREDWANPYTHPHKYLKCGDNTLPMILCMHLASQIASDNGFKFSNWIERYKSVMTNRTLQPDTFVPSIHRRYFENLAKGIPPEKNGCAEAHISDFTIFLPLFLMSYAHLEDAKTALIRALKPFTIGEDTLNCAMFVMDIFSMLISGLKLDEVLFKKMSPDSHYALAYPYRRWVKASNDDEAMAGLIGRTAELEKAVVLSIYLSLKYGSDYESAMIANTNMGGETTGRGALIGAIIACQYGRSVIPQRWIDKLSNSTEIALGLNNLMPVIQKGLF